MHKFVGVLDNPPVRKVASGKMLLLWLLLVFVRTEIPVRTLHKYLQIIISWLTANSSSPLVQLNLALAWNRIDVAKSEIFTEEKHWTVGRFI